MFRIGICAYYVMPDIFQQVLKCAKEIADEVLVIWGPYKGFEAPWLDPPEIPDGIKLEINKDPIPQHEKRDLYLKGLKPGDVLWTIDSDEVPGPNVKMIKAELDRIFKDPTWDACVVRNFYPGFFRDCSPIRIFRIQKGKLSHSVGQLLQVNGKTMTTDQGFKVINPDHIMLHVIHHKKKKSPNYIRRQKDMWGSNG